MNWDTIDWQALERLRTSFLQGSAGQQDYWQRESDLASYDQTFAQRIGWKWDYVWLELERRGWTPPPGAILDWGCGSGVAGRAMVDHIGVQNVQSLLLWDRSALAMLFAEQRAHERFPELEVSIDALGGASFSTLLLSHVLTELNDRQVSHLLERASSATALVWVEPGTREASRRLSGLRERLRRSFNVVAPCPHQGACGVLAPDNTPHWCHHFAAPPPAVFTDGNWARFAALAGIDLRSLPLSFLVLDKRPVPQLPTGSVRVIGSPRLYKGHALLLGCDAAGLSERRLSKRVLPEEFRKLKKGAMDSLQIWELDQDEVVKVENATARPSPDGASTD